MDLSKFHVVTTIFNPANSQRRIDLFNAFRQHMAESGIQLWIVEVAQGNHPFVCTEADNPFHLQLRTTEVLWHKERSLNLMVQRLPSDWQYVCWVDADIEFPNWRPDGHAWYEETWRRLQLFPIVQLFHTCLDLGPSYEVLEQHKSFAYCYDMGMPWGPKYTFWHPGYAWGCTRDAWNGMGGLIDWAILGSGDHSMATALIGKVDASIHGKMSSPYFEAMRAYQNTCQRTIRRDLGYVPNTILHYWHGKKKDRRYQDRWKILTDNQFNPTYDLKPDSTGLYRLVDHGDQRSIDLKRQVRQYFFMRNEDSIDL